ncbi:cupin domain-containing protein [Novosphingobium aquimarinum]|uniref:cupin n=1 Tax=Novosphingobium aquimarinum TaxID=2682494 RepID=UPI0012EBDEF6|nr:cupin [Novosphingobium aquimarinum]
MTRSARDIRQFPVHLGLGATTVAQPEFTGGAWYEAYAERHGADGAEGRLVAMHTFTSDWTTWEIHPEGEELVLCIAGQITILQELAEGQVHSETIGAGEYLVNPAGVWHTADVAERATVLFVTPGLGTENRER